MRSILLCLLLVGCAQELQEPFGIWVTPIVYSVDESCPESVRASVEDVMSKFSPVPYSEGVNGNMPISCETEPDGGLFGDANARSALGMANPSPRTGIIIYCPIWISPAALRRSEDTMGAVHHESGHCLGLKHAINRKSGMTKRIPTRPRGLGEVDRIELNRIYNR